MIYVLIVINFGDFFENELEFKDFVVFLFKLFIFDVGDLW